MITCHTYREHFPPFHSLTSHSYTSLHLQLPANLAGTCAFPESKQKKSYSPYHMYADKMWQVADWLESYAHSLELDVWTSSTVTRASQDPETKKWTVEIERANAEPRSFVVNHLVFAIGFAGGTYKTPQVPGAVGVHAMLNNFARTLLNSIQSSVLG